MKKFETITTIDLLIEYIRSGKVKTDKTKSQGFPVYHDPCNYGRKAFRRFGHAYFDEPRWIMDQCYDNWAEMYPNRMNQICCGGGGGTLTTGYNEERIYYARKKIDQITRTGADTVVVPCHGCHGQFENIKKEYGMPDLKVKYLWESVAECMIV